MPAESVLTTLGGGPVQAEPSAHLMGRTGQQSPAGHAGRAGSALEVCGQLLQSSPFSPCFAGCLGKLGALVSPGVRVPRVQQAPAVLRVKAFSRVPRPRTRMQ